VNNVKAEGRKEVLYSFIDEDGETHEGVKVEAKYKDEETGGMAKVEIKYEGGLDTMKEEKEVKEEIVDQPGIGDGVLEVLDRIDGTEEIGD